MKNKRMRKQNKEIIKIDDERYEEMRNMSGSDFVDEVTKILAAIRQEARDITEEVKENGTEEEKKALKEFYNTAIECLDDMTDSTERWMKNSKKKKDEKDA